MRYVKLIHDREMADSPTSLSQISDSLHIFPELKTIRTPEGTHFMWGCTSGKKRAPKKGSETERGKTRRRRRRKQLGV